MKKSLYTISFVYAFIVILACGGAPRPLPGPPIFRDPGVVSETAATSPTGFHIRVDEFTGHTTRMVSFFLYPESPERTGGSGDLFAVSVSSTGEPQNIGLLFHFSHREWEYLTCNHVAILADTIPVALGEVEHSGSVHRGGVSEHISVRISYGSLLQLANATSVRVRICTTVFRTDTELGQWALELIESAEASIVPPVRTPDTDAGVPSSPVRIP